MKFKINYNFKKQIGGYNSTFKHNSISKNEILNKKNSFFFEDNTLKLVVSSNELTSPLNIFKRDKDEKIKKFIDTKKEYLKIGRAHV